MNDPLALDQQVVGAVPMSPIPVPTCAPAESEGRGVTDAGSLDTKRVFVRGKYAIVQVSALVTQYSRIRAELAVSAPGKLVAPRFDYAKRVADYLSTARGELEVRGSGDERRRWPRRFGRNARPNLPVTTNLLSMADRSLVWLYPREVLQQRCKIVSEQLHLMFPPPKARIENLERELTECEQRQSDQSDRQIALRSALEDALTCLSAKDERGLIEEDLQVTRLRILIWYLLAALVLLLSAIPFTTTVIRDTAGAVVWPVFSMPVSVYWPPLVVSALGLAAIGAVGGIVSGMLKVRDTRASLASYRVSMFNLALRPLIGAIAALVLYVFLSWNVIQGINITNPGVYLLTAFLAGFSERYFLRIVQTAAEPAAERKRDTEDD